MVVLRLRAQKHTARVVLSPHHKPSSFIMAICPQLQANGSCTNESCTYGHNLYFCEPCGVITNSENILAQHLRGKKHQKISVRELISCPVCQINIKMSDWPSHSAGRSHQKLLARRGLPATVQPEEPLQSAGHVYCSLCKENVRQSAWQRHRSGRHIFRERIAGYQALLDAGEKDKNGVSVTRNGDFGVLDSAVAKSGLSVNLTIENAIPISHITIVGVNLGTTSSNGSG